MPRRQPEHLLEMRSRFPGYYAPSSDQLEKVWNEGAFAIDASVLLGLYRYPEDSREALFSALESLGDRLWLPHQGGLEFQRNRLAVIAEQRMRFGQVKKVVQTVPSSLHADLARLQLERRHSVIDPKPLEQAIEGVVDTFVKSLDEQRQRQHDVHEEDVIRERIGRLFGDRIGEPFTQKQLDEIYAEGQQRYERRTPPGFEDHDKASGAEPAAYEYAGLVYRREFGDLVLWKQVLAYARERKPIGIVLLTDDEKDDWWWRVESEGKKKLGPRPELVAEVLAESEATVYCQYNSESFMSLAVKYLQLPISETQISKVKDVRQVEREARGLAGRDEVGFSLDLMAPRSDSCVFFITVRNGSDRDLPSKNWGAALQLEGSEYELRCTAVTAPLELETPGHLPRLDLAEQLQPLDPPISAGESRSGWILARYGRHVTEDMIKRPDARFHFTGVGRRLWSGPSYGPAEARRFHGPSVEPELKHARVAFAELPPRSVTDKEPAE